MPIIIFEIENVNIEEAELTDGGGEMGCNSPLKYVPA